ncbi:exodeoxyribonuclease VII small subunit [Oscillospiraceae bacterium MB08-C2-2]|nr:exodeoxyribonuclease VII small subunit [Oscillospiraceae bacterium MB08-C2-2]
MKKGTTFEQAMARLEEITAQLGKGDTTLDASLKLYAEGAELVAFCDQALSSAALTIQKLYPPQEDKADA